MHQKSISVRNTPVNLACRVHFDCKIGLHHRRIVSNVIQNKNRKIKNNKEFTHFFDQYIQNETNSPGETFAQKGYLFISKTSDSKQISFVSLPTKIQLQALPCLLLPYRTCTPKLMGTHKNSNIRVHKFVMFTNIQFRH